MFVHAKSVLLFVELYCISIINFVLRTVVILIDLNLR